MALIALRAMVKKDLQVFFSDRKAVIMSYIVPIAIASFFGAIFSGAGGSSQPSKITAMVVDLDNGAISRAIVAGVASDKALAVTTSTADSARDAVRRGKVSIAIIIPPGFGDAAGKSLFGGQNKPTLEIDYDPSHAAEFGMVSGMLTGHVMEAVSREMFSGARGPALVDESLHALDTAQMSADAKQQVRALLQAAHNFFSTRAGPAGGSGQGQGGGLTVPYTVDARAAIANADAPYNGYAHSFGGMGIQFMLFATIDLGIGILLERQRGLWKRLRSAPLSKGALLGGKAISGMLIALSTILVSFAFAIIVFKVRISGSVIGFLSVAAATALMASTFGLMIAAVGRTPGATRGVSILAVLMMVMLGGAWIPQTFFPAWLVQATMAIPTKWAVDGVDAMTWRGVGASGAILPTAVLLAFAALFCGIAIWRFRWEES